MKIKVITLAIFLICQNLIVAVMPAQAIEPWKISILSSLSNIEQFENRELKFSVSISDKEVINHLKMSGASVVGGVILTPLIRPEYTNEARGLTKSKKLYECYNHVPNALGGNEGGTALQGVKAGDDNQIDLMFGCWFPVGMKIQIYTLSIRLSVFVNGSCCTRPVPNFWDNTQFFYFGNYPESARPSWWMVNPPVNLRVNIISEMPEINVIRSAPRTSSEFLSVNSKNLKEEIAKLKSKSQETIELNIKYLNTFEATNKKLEFLLTRAINLESRYQKSKYFGEIQEAISQLKTNQNQIIRLSKVFNDIKPGSSADNAKLNYLFALDMQTTWQPEVLSVVYPNPHSISTGATTYLRMFVRSKTPITSTDVALTYSEKCCVVFRGNVIIPGESAEGSNYQAGQGLALIENQQWDGSVFLTSLLISPASTLKENYEIDVLNQPSCALALIEDVAGNVSNYWNWPLDSYFWPKNLECNPRTTQTLDETKDFDNLKQLYNDLAEANNDLQKLKIINGNLETELSGLFRISAEADEFSSKLDVLAVRLSEEQVLLAKAAKLKAKQEAEAKAAATKAIGTKKTTITCAKGKLTKKVTAVKPVCPPGYKKK